MSQILKTLKPIAITMGDPAGIGGECIIAAWRQREEHQFTPFFLIDNIGRLKKIAPDINFIKINEPKEANNIFAKAIPVLHLDLPEQPIAGQLNPKNGKAVIESIRTATLLAQNGGIAGVVTNPIHKAALYNIGFEFAGHTEYLGSLCHDAQSVMMLATDELRVVPLTVHHRIKDIPKMLTEDLILQKIRIVNHDLKEKFGIKNPRLAVSGLNPHAGEGGAMGDEEIKIISPAIKKLKAAGMNIMGPHPADTLFHAEARKNYDVAICMYHDQALIPLKTLDFHGGVNITLGLPIIRTSPDHGTALDIAGKGLSNPSSLIAAIKMAEKLAINKK